MSIFLDEIERRCEDNPILRKRFDAEQRLRFAFREWLMEYGYEKVDAQALQYKIMGEVYTALLLEQEGSDWSIGRKRGRGPGKKNKPKDPPGENLTSIKDVEKVCTVGIQVLPRGEK
jgi:hypothetical protein